jgi:ketosteroid isomerase-like protein
MYKSAVRWMIRRNIRALNAGDPGPLLGGYADDAVLVFPGRSSWGGEYRGKVAIEEFVNRFGQAHLVGTSHEILVNGPPWRMFACVVFSDQATDDVGEIVYRNRAVLFVRASWGKIRYQEDFLDTEKVAAFDDYLSPATRAISAPSSQATTRPGY